jgi:hypothetical protein
LRTSFFSGEFADIVERIKIRLKKRLSAHKQ